MSKDKKQLNKKQKQFLDNDRALYLEAYTKQKGYKRADQILLDVANNPDTPLREIVQSCLGLLPYTIPKAPAPAQEINHSGSVDTKVTHDVAPAIAQIHDLLRLQATKTDEDTIIEGEVAEVPDK